LSRAPGVTEKKKREGSNTLIMRGRRRTVDSWEGVDRSNIVAGGK